MVILLIVGFVFSIPRKVFRLSNGNLIDFQHNMLGIRGQQTTAWNSSSLVLIHAHRLGRFIEPRPCLTSDVNSLIHVLL